MDPKSKNIIERVKAAILNKEGISGIHSVARLLRRMDSDGSRNLDKTELLEGLREYQIDNVTPTELQTLFRFRFLKNEILFREK